MKQEQEIDEIILELEADLKKYNKIFRLIAVTYVVVFSLSLYLLLHFLPKELSPDETNKFLLWIDKNVDPNMGIRFDVNGVAPFSNKLENFYSLYIFPYIWSVLSLIIFILLIMKQKLIDKHVINNEIFKYKDKEMYLYRIRENYDFLYSACSTYRLLKSKTKNIISFGIGVFVLLYIIYPYQTYICILKPNRGISRGIRCHYLESVYSFLLANIHICLIFSTSFILFIIFYILRGVDDGK